MVAQYGGPGTRLQYCGSRGPGARMWRLCLGVKLAKLFTLAVWQHRATSAIRRCRLYQALKSEVC